MQFKDRITASRKSEVAMDFLVEVGELGRGVPRKQVGVALARAMMLAEPRLTPYYRGFSKSFWVNENKPLWLTGTDVISLLWNQNAVEFIRKQFENEDFLKKVQEQFNGWGSLLKITEQTWSAYPGILHFDSPFEAKMDPLLKDLGLKYTLKKLSDGNYSYELIPASLKKDIIKKLEITKTAKGTSVQVSPGSKFDLPQFMARAFKLPQSQHWVKVQARAQLDGSVDKQSDHLPKSTGFSTFNS